MMQHQEQAEAKGTSAITAPSPSSSLSSSVSVLNDGSAVLPIVVAPSVDPNAVDEMLTQELQQLSFQDRTAIQEEIHGVGTVCPEETTGTIRSSLSQMDSAIQTIPHKVGYDQAQSQSNESRFFVTNDDVRLSFLRCDLFDAKRAAQRFTSYLDMVLNKFGSQCLGRWIQWDDIGCGAQEQIKKGNIQLLPYRDRSGRRVIVITDLGLDIPAEYKMRAAAYLYTVAVADIESQRKGLVMVVWPAGDGTNGLKIAMPDPREHIEFSRVFGSLPVRVCSFHFCSIQRVQDGPPHPLIRVARAAFLVIMGKSNRNREQLHVGDRMEVMYKLMSYGIPVNLIPLNDAGCVKTKNIIQWIKARRFQEAIDNLRRRNTIQSLHNNNHNNVTATTDLCFDKDNNNTNDVLPIVIECPLSTDVIFRNGQSGMSHPGNVMFRGLLETYYEQHRLATNNQEKVAITWRVVDEVLEQRQGRFLMWESFGGGGVEDYSTISEEVRGRGVAGWWTPIVDREKIRAKVAVSLRDERKRIQGIRQQQQSAGGTYRFMLNRSSEGHIPRNELLLGGKRKRGGGDGPNPFFADDRLSEGDEFTGMSCCNVRRML